MRMMRLLAALSIVAGVVVAAVLVSIPQESVQGEVAAFTSSAQCAECHQEIAREWKASWHGQAYTDPEVLKLTKNFQDEQCISCHAPAPIFATGVGERVFERRERMQDGVDCIACHLLPDGRVAGKRGLLNAPCRPSLEPRLSAAVFCAGCHNQHWTVDEFMASKWPETHTCNVCHMQRVTRPLVVDGPVREGVASHLFEGAHFPWMLKKAVTVKAEVDGRFLVIRITNSGAGHKIPTDSRHKSFNLLVTLRDEAGNLLTEQEEVAEYRLYYRTQARESTQILPHETREERYELPGGVKGTAVIEFVYCPKPPTKRTKEWTLVEALELAF